MKIIKNPDQTKYNIVTKAVLENDGYCPCSIVKSADTKCICKAFREQNAEGACHCGRYIKTGGAE